MSEQLQNHIRNYPEEWEFLQVVRALERLTGDSRRRRAHVVPAAEQQEAPSGERPLRTEPPPVRYRTSTSMGFPTAEVAAVASRDEKVEGGHEIARVWDVAVTFLGLHGATGAMPRSDIGESLYLAGSPNNKSMVALFDLLGSPFIGLFAAAMRKYRAPLEWERSTVATGHDVIGRDSLETAMLSLVGSGSREFRSENGPRFQLRQLIRMGAAFSAPHRTALGLADVLRLLLEVPVTVEQFQPVWREIPEEDRTRCGGPYAALGRNAVSGRRFCDVASGVLVTVGPVGLPLFLSLLPSGALYGPVADLVAMYLGQHLRCKLKPILRKEEVPGSHLGAKAKAPCRLGRSSWLAAKHRSDDYDKTVVTLSPFDVEGERDE
jgi:type VI secretion system protein ImpH